MKLKIPFETFKTTINEFALEVKEVSNGAYSEEALVDAKKNFSEWQTRCVAFLKDSIESDAIQFIQDVRSLGNDLYESQGGRPFDLDRRIRDFDNMVRSSASRLLHNLRILSLSDPIITDGSFDVSERQSLDTEGKMEFLLRKLIQGDTGESHYPAKFIFEENGINLNMGEAHSLVKELLNARFVESFGGMGTPMVKISTAGKLIIEKMDKEANKQAPLPQQVKNVYYVENAHNSVIQQGNTGGVQNAAVTISTNQMEDIKAFLVELKETIAELNLQVDDKEELASDIEAIEALSKSPKPKVITIKGIFKSIGSILEKASISAIAKGMVDKTPALIAKLEALINSFPQ